MNNKFKRFTQVLLTTLMLLSLIPITNISAEGSDQVNDPKPAQELQQESNSEDTNDSEDNSDQNGYSVPEIIEVIVPAIWYPVDKDTNEVLDYLTPISTIPDMYPRSEVAKLNAEEIYEIDYMGVPKPAPGGWSTNNFMYTANLFFRDEFHRVVAQGRDERNFDEEISAVRKLEYGSFTDEAVFNTSTGKYTGLHGMTKAPYQEGQTMKLYIATETEDTSLSDAIFTEEILNYTYASDDQLMRKSLYKNIEEVKFNDFDNWAQIRTINGIENQEELKERLETIYIYKYDSPSKDTGAFITEDGKYKDFNLEGSSFEGLENGLYEVVFPIYWQRNVPDYMSAPDVFSRNRYQYDDTIHFTINLTVPTSSLSLEKTTDVDTYSKVGDIIKYKFTVTNTGETELEGSFQIFDDKIENSIVSTRLAPGNSFSETKEYSVTQADIELGSITNIAYVTHWNIVSERVEKTVTLAPLKASLTDATITRGTSISLGTGGYGGNLMTITGGNFDVTPTSTSLPSYSWKKVGDDIPFSNDKNPTVSPTIDTKYEFTVTDINGSTAAATMTVFVRAPYVPPTLETIDVVVNKVWVGGPTVKPTIELQLYRNDDLVDGRLATLENGTTTYTWNGLRKFDPAGVEYIYTVKEVTELKNYTKVEAGLTVTNTFIEEQVISTVDITGNKIWILGPEIKPVIELQLYRNGLAYREPVELFDGTTSYTWTGLEKTDAQGNDYTYTIDEVSTPENYDKLVSADGLTVTNIFFEVAGDVVIDEPTDKPTDKPEVKPTVTTPPTGIHNFESLYTITLVLGSAALFVLSKRKEEDF